MKQSLLCLLLFLSLSGSAQRLAFYSPKGEKYPGKLKSVKDVLDSLQVEDNRSYSHKYGEVYVTELYRAPLFIILWDSKHPEQIKDMIAVFGLKRNEYLSSYDYFADLRKLQKNGALTDEFVSETFGKPSVTIKKEDADSTRIYFNHNCSFNYNFGIVNSVEVYNYKDAIYKHKLSIDEYNVIGNDYSIGFNITITNYSPKKIKYVYFSTVAKNPVDDVVGKKTFSGVGPIELGESASYSFDDGIYSKSAETLSIESIRILYFDGTQKILTRPIIKSIFPRQDWAELE